jgi:carbon monoxide dehydrogenase subunit G
VANPGNEFGGQEQFQATPQALYGLLTNLDSMAATIPDLVSAEKVDDCTIKCVVRPGFSFLRGTMKLNLSLGEASPPERATMHVDAQGIGVAMKVVSQLSIAPREAGSQLDWTATIVERKGLIAAVSPSLIKAAADQVIRHAWQQVRAKLGEA